VDQDRQIRFLIPPFFLYASLLWGAALDPSICLAAYLRQGSPKDLIGIVTAAGVATIPLGFFLGAVTVIALRILFLFVSRAQGRRQVYEAYFSNASFKRIWQPLVVNRSRDRKLLLYAAVTFDHELLEKGVHEWLMRRWNAFNVAASSCIALILAHLFGYMLRIRPSCKWYASTAVVLLFLFVTAVTSWSETMGMVDFQSFRSHPKSRRD
jgi:hypothetical protein